MTQLRVARGGADGREVVPLDELVEGWLRSGLISPEQAAVMTSPEGGRDDASLRQPLPVVAEALAYVGGAVVIAGSSLLAAYYWGDLASWSRFLLLVGAAVALLAAGAAVPEGLASAGRRLRGVLWLLGTGAWAGAMGVLVADVVPAGRIGTDLEPVLVSGATTALTAALWAWHRFGLQHAATLAGAAALAGTAVAWSDLSVEPGVAVWVVGVGWAGLGLARVIAPVEMPLVLGSSVAILGAMTASDSDAGMVFVLVTIAAVVALAVARRDLLLLTVGAGAALLNLPAAMSRWFAGSVAAATALVVVGAVLVTLAVWIARRARD